MRWLESLAEDSATLQAYLREIARFPSLSGAQESALAERARQRDVEALSRLVESHLGLVVRYARRYQSVGVPLIALVRDGNLALVEAARRFDPGRHGRFRVFALWWLRQSVLYRMSQLAPGDGSGEPGRFDGRVADALHAAVDFACAPDGRADEDLTAHEVRMLDEWWRRAPLSGSALADEPFDIDAIAPALDEPEEAVRRALVADLETSLLELEPRERRALERSLGLDTAPPGLGRQVSARVSPSRVSKLSSRAVRKLCVQRALKSAIN